MSGLIGLGRVEEGRRAIGKSIYGLIFLKCRESIVGGRREVSQG